MLKMYIRERGDIPKNVEVIHDVEKEFSLLDDVKNTETVHELMRYIEHANWCNEYSFIDRFGCKLYISNLSTGCKAAILAVLSPDKIVDLRECGANARNAIVTFVKDGSIIMDENDLDLDLGLCKKGIKINVSYNGKIFKDILSLNNYLQYGYYDEVKHNV